jgi:hypothetical protein
MLRFVAVPRRLCTLVQRIWRRAMFLRSNGALSAMAAQPGVAASSCGGDNTGGWAGKRVRHNIRHTGHIHRLLVYCILIWMLGDAAGGQMTAATPWWWQTAALCGQSTAGRAYPRARNGNVLIAKSVGASFLTIGIVWKGADYSLLIMPKS